MPDLPITVRHAPRTRQRSSVGAQDASEQRVAREHIGRASGGARAPHMLRTAAAALPAWARAPWLPLTDMAVARLEAGLQEACHNGTRGGGQVSDTVSGGGAGHTVGGVLSSRRRSVGGCWVATRAEDAGGPAEHPVKDNQIKAVAKPQAVRSRRAAPTEPTRPRGGSPCGAPSWASFLPARRGQGKATHSYAPTPSSSLSCKPCCRRRPYAARAGRGVRNR